MSLRLKFLNTVIMLSALLLFGCGDSGNSVNGKVSGSCVIDDVCTNNVAFEDCDGAFESDALCPAELPLFEQKLIENENVLREMFERYIMSITGLVSTTECQELFSVFSNESVVNDRRSRLVTCLRTLGVGLPLDEGFSGFIREPLIIELLIYALADSERDLRRDAFDRLIRSTEWRLLSPFKSDIREAIAKDSDPFAFSTWYFPHPADTLLLFSLLNPTASEKQQWLGLAETLVQRAALGDVQSEDTLIAQFENANTIFRLEDLAFDLALVGFSSQRSRIALVKGLETDVLRTYDSGMYIPGVGPLEVYAESGIIPVITTLRRVHPAEPLFYGEFNALKGLMHVNDQQVIDYFTRLATWAEQTYDITLNLPKEYSFIRTWADDLPKVSRPENTDTDEDRIPNIR